MISETLWQKLRRNLGLEDKKPEPLKTPSPSDQKAIDRAIPRRYDPKIQPKEVKPKPDAKKAKRRPVKPAKAENEDEDEKDVTSSMYDFRGEA